MKNKEPAQYRAAGGVRYEFKRKRVKNINLRVRADGSVAVSAPLGITKLSSLDENVLIANNIVFETRRLYLSMQHLRLPENFYSNYNSISYILPF